MPPWSLVWLPMRLRSGGATANVLDASLEFFDAHLLSVKGCEDCLERIEYRKARGDYAGDPDTSRAVRDIGENPERWVRVSRRAGIISPVLTSERFYEPAAYADAMAAVREVLFLHSVAHYPWRFGWDGIFGPPEPSADPRSDSPMTRFFVHTLLPNIDDRDPDVVVFCASTAGQVSALHALAPLVAASVSNRRTCVYGGPLSGEGCGVTLDVVCADAEALVRHLIGTGPLPADGVNHAVRAPAGYLTPRSVTPLEAGINSDVIHPDGGYTLSQEPIDPTTASDIFAGDGAASARTCRGGLSLYLDAGEVDASALGRAGISMVRWEPGNRLPAAFTRQLVDFSRAGIWNHVSLPSQGKAALELARFAGRNPNIVHSWCVQGSSEASRTITQAVSAYSGLTALPGRPFWRMLRDPAHLLLHVVQVGTQRLSRLRVDGHEVFELGRHLEFHYREPSDIPAALFEEICLMVESGGAVGSAGRWVRRNLQNAFLIGYVQERGVLVGHCSLKQPRPEYVETVSGQTGLNLSGHLERGYTSVRPEYRGLGVATKLGRGLAARARGRRIFLVIADDNLAAQKGAIRNNNIRVGGYCSERLKRRVGIWMQAEMVEPDQPVPRSREPE